MGADHPGFRPDGLPDLSGHEPAVGEINLTGLHGSHITGLCREIGTRTAIDLLNSEQSYAVSRRDLTSALYDNVQRQIELKSAAGILSDDDLTAISGKAAVAKLP